MVQSITHAVPGLSIYYTFIPLNAQYTIHCTYMVDLNILYPPSSLSPPPDTLSLLFLLTIVMFVFAGIGITLFGNNCPNYFGSLGSGEQVYKYY